jgi:hypothetical protein
MQRMILIALSFGLIVSSVSAQPADEPRTEAGYVEYGGESPSRMGGMPGRERQIDPRQTQRLIERWKTSKEAAEREKLETELRQLLKREFASRLAVHEREIKQLEEKIRQLRERLSLRKEKQEEIVEHRLQQILREAQGLGWGSEGGRSESVFQQTTDAAAPAASDPFAPAEIDALDATADPENLFGEAPSSDLQPAPR